MKIKEDELKSIRIDLKKVIKGRPLYFGLMAPGSKRGKFKLSKKKGEVKPPNIKKDFQPYEDEKDNNLKGAACQGVVTGERGVLTLHVDGKAPGAGLKFLNYFILRELKYKVVKDIRLAENAAELPVVPEEDEDFGVTADELRQRLTELLQEVQGLSEEERQPIIVPALAAKKIIDLGENATAEQLSQADDLLDEAYGLLFDSRPSGGSEDQSTESTIDVAELDKHLNHAKDMAGLLPAGRATDLASRIALGRKQLDASDLEEAQETILGLEDEIDGAFQDFFLDQLKGIEKHLKTFPQDVLQAFNTCRKSIRRRDWPKAGEEWETLKKVIAEWRKGQTSSGSESSPPPAPPAPAPPPPPPPVAEPKAKELDSVALSAWEERQNELKQQLVSILQGDPNAIDGDTKKKLGLLFEKSNELARQKHDYSQAGMAHGAIATLLISAGKSSDEVAEELGVQPGYVAFRHAQRRWNTGLADVRKELGRIGQAIRSTAPEDAELADELDIVLAGFQGRLEDIIKAGMDAPDDEDRVPHGRRAIRVMDRFRFDLESDELVALLDDCPFCKIEIRNTLATALDDLSTRMNTFLAG